MNINIEEFKRVLKKATINFSLDSVQLNFKKDKINSKMVTNSNDAVVVLDIPNTVIPEMNIQDEVQFNFHDPNQTLIPYIGLIEETDQTNINIMTEKIVLNTNNLKSNIFFCSPHVVAAFTRDNIRPGHDPIKEFKLTDDFIKQFNMIKKIGMRFGKVYFGISNKMFVMETTDKTNRFSNGLRFDLFTLDSEDMCLCFDYKNFVNVMAAIDDEYEDFIFSIIFVPDSELGLIIFNKIDNSERYYLMSKQDN